MKKKKEPVNDFTSVKNSIKKKQLSLRVFLIWNYVAILISTIWFITSFWIDPPNNVTGWEAIIWSIHGLRGLVFGGAVGGWALSIRKNNELIKEGNELIRRVDILEKEELLAHNLYHINEKRHKIAN